MRTRWHLLHMFAGIGIAVLLGIHMTIIHLDAVLNFFGASINDPTSWAAMIDRSRQALWAGIYIALLGVVLYHALYGLRGIILEVARSPRAERIVTRSFIVFGIVVFAWTAYVPIALLPG